MWASKWPSLLLGSEHFPTDGGRWSFAHSTVLGAPALTKSSVRRTLRRAACGARFGCVACARAARTVGSLKFTTADLQEVGAARANWW